MRSTIRTEYAGTEWVRLPKPGQRLCGLSRTSLLELGEAGKIKIALIRKRNAVRGIRLLWLPSLLQLLERLSAE
jgi:hypothetical protein